MSVFSNFIHKLKYLGTENLSDVDPIKRVCIGLNMMCFAIILLDLTFGLFFTLLTGKLALLLALISELVLIPIPLLFNYYEKHKAAVRMFFSIVLFETLIFCIVLGKAVEGQLMIIYLVGVSIFLFDKFRIQLTYIVASFTILVLVELNFNYNLIEEIDATPTAKFYMRWGAYIAISILCLLTFFWYKSNNNVLLKKVREEKEKTETDLQTKELENQIKDKFISNAYHETKVSFHACIDIVNVLDKAKSPAEFSDMIKSLKTALQGVELLTENILQYEKNQVENINLNRIKNELVNVRSIVNNAISIYQYSADQKRIILHSEIDEAFPEFILTDKIKLNQILSNLLSNAIYFSKFGGKIFVKVESQLSKSWSISVTDQGPGISVEMRNKLFAPFTSTNPKGVGLGLYIVNHIVTSFGGIMTADDNVEGAKFKITLPLTNGLNEKELRFINAN